MERQGFNPQRLHVLLEERKRLEEEGMISPHAPQTVKTVKPANRRKLKILSGSLGVSEQLPEWLTHLDAACGNSLVRGKPLRRNGVVTMRSELTVVRVVDLSPPAVEVGNRGPS